MRRLMLAVAVGAIAISLGGAEAQPAAKKPVGCGPLFSALLAYAEASPGNRIHVVWTTNHFAHETRFAGWSALWLAAQGKDLRGIGERKRMFFEGMGPGSEKAALLIRADHQIVFNDQLGPFQATCSGGRFAVVDSGDSIETLHFAVPPAFMASGAKKCPQGMKQVGEACFVRE